MHTYQYQPGDTPLAGYTIKSAAGHGGFGEVYYAVSDSGREVALKAVQGYEQIELRGIRQCMNLKSPHLVTIFDVKNNDKGQPFVLMEYVSGPSLADLIDDSPNGLGPEKTAFFLREIAKGLSYLHDCGIVHRDLKPANIFYENGYVKIGDYGLSKAISANQNHSQTVTVGTVHYMAPEVGAGRYDRSIDIYAMGVVVYEMLTGRVPFKGDTPSEILMKHLSATPEMESIEEPFRAVIKKALVKDPADRYQSVNEMVEAVFGQERMKQSMASFSTADLSMVAGQVAKKVRVGGGSGSGASYDTGNTYQDQSDPGEYRPSPQADDVRGRVAQDRGLGARPHIDLNDDPVQTWKRRVLALVALGAVSLGAVHLSGLDADSAFVFMFMTSIGAVLGLSAAHKYMLPDLESESGFVKRIVPAGTAVLGAGLLSSPLTMDDWGVRVGFNHSMFAIAVALCLMNWPKAMSPRRTDRIALGPAITAGLLGWIASWFFENASGFMAFGVPAGVMLAVQALSPFVPKSNRGVSNKVDDYARWVNDFQAAERSADRRDERPQAKHVAGHRTEQVNAYSAVVTSNTSPRSRLVALLFALVPFVFPPICGLQRFYAGKVGTGILWLLTFGFFYVGQIVDLILIATGTFDDGAGRPIREWQPEWRPKGVKARQVEAHVGKPRSAVMGDTQPLLPSLFSVLLSFVGSLMILIGLTLGLGLALHVPEAISSGVVMPGLAGELTSMLGYDRWPGLFNEMGQAFSGGLFFLGGVALILARRGLGGVHMLRAGLATLVLTFLIPIVTPELMRYNMGDRWFGIVDELNNNRIGPALELFKNSFDIGEVIILGLAVLACVFTLAWPANRRASVTPERVEEGA